MLGMFRKLYFKRKNMLCGLLRNRLTIYCVLHPNIRCLTESASALNVSERPSNLQNDENGSDEEYLPTKSKVVICGGGVVGLAVAYHLAKLGWGKHTILVTQGRLGGDISWPSAGLVGVFKPTRGQVRLCQSSVKLYQEIEAGGFDIGWKQCGSLCVARTRNRMTHFQRMHAQSVSWNIDCELVTAERAAQLSPQIRVDDLKGGLWIPGDGVAHPYKLHLALSQSATKKGVQMFEKCSVKEVLSEGGRVVGVKFRQRSVECEAFVNCDGLWARSIGQLSEPTVKVPLHAVEHYLLQTKPIPQLEPSTPVVRDQDGHIYFREYEGSILAGGFEPVAKPAYEDGYIPRSLCERTLPWDWDHFLILLEQLLHRVPTLGRAERMECTNDPEAFSPDCKWVLGEAPEIANYFVAAGMKSSGISAAGGIGQAIAELIVHGQSSFDMYELDISRFLGLHNNSKFLRDRVKEVPGLYFGLIYPFHEFTTGRNLRMSPIYPKLREAGAVFGQVMGYERPVWFDPEDSNVGIRVDDGEVEGKPYRIAETSTFGKPPWFDFVDAEYTACRETVGLSDYSSFTKIDLWSKGLEVVDALQYLCSNDVDVPVGSIIHTGMQNKNGGYENDCSLARLSDNHYMMIAPTIQQTRCKAWIQRHLPRNGSVSLSDVTSMFTAICIMGPFTRTLLSEITDTDLSPSAFPFFTFKELDVGFANGIRAMNLTHTGELGYVLYVPNEFALHVYTCLIEAGAKYNLRHAGYYAMRALRVEKFYAFWGQDLDTATTPLECGRTWRVKFDKGEFIGRDALLRQREEGVKRMYVQLLLNDHDAETELWSWGGEPIYRDNKYVGETTTTGYGFTFKKQVCLGFVQNLDSNNERQIVTNDYVLSGTYEVDIAGNRYSAKVNLHSPNLPTKFPDKEREAYHATRDKMVSEPLLRAY